MEIDGTYYSFNSIEDMNINEFKMICSFLDENKLQRLLRIIKDYKKWSYINSILSAI